MPPKDFKELTLKTQIPIISSGSSSLSLFSKASTGSSSNRDSRKEESLERSSSTTTTQKLYFKNHHVKGKLVENQLFLLNVPLEFMLNRYVECCLRMQDQSSA